MTLDGTTMTDRGIPGFRGSGPGDTLALVVCWCPDEPHRLGEVFLLPRQDRPYVLGRGDSALDGHERVSTVRQRPGDQPPQPPIAIRRLSRHQLSIDVEMFSSLRVRNVGRCRLYHDGHRVDEVEVRAGDLLQLGSCLLLLCTVRPWQLHGAQAAEDHVFGEPDALGIVGESPSVWAARNAAGESANLRPPALNARREDVPLVARHVLRELAAADPGVAERFFDGAHPRIGPALARQLVSHDYSSDRGELEAMLRASVAASDGNFLDVTSGTPARRVLVVDRNTARRVGLVRALGEAWQVVAVADPDAAYQLPARPYDAAVIDGALPVRTLRPFAQWARTVTGCRVVALLGDAPADLDAADADLAVPEDPDALIAALGGSLDHTTGGVAVVAVQAGSVDLPARTVINQGKEHALTPTEAKLFAYLAERAGRPVARDELLTEVWGYRAGVESRTVDTTVRRLRKKVEIDHREPFHIRTVTGVGYQFVPLEG